MVLGMGPPCQPFLSLIDATFTSCNDRPPRSIPGGAMEREDDGGGGAAYRHCMPSWLRDVRGEPALPTRLLALLVVIGLVVLTAPLIVLPVAHAIAQVLF